MMPIDITEFGYITDKETDMKTYHRSTLSAIAFVVLLILSTTASAETYAVDPAHSSIVFRIKHLDISYVYGRFNNVSGMIQFDPAADDRNAVEMAVSATDVDTGNSKRDAHLKGADFFNSDEHKAVSFKSKSFKKKTENTYEISGDLTLLGITKPITVTALKTGEGKDPWGGFRIGFETTFGIKRSDFRMTNMIGSVGDDVHITVSIEGVRK